MTLIDRESITGRNPVITPEDAAAAAAALQGTPAPVSPPDPAVAEAEAQATAAGDSPPLSEADILHEYEALSSRMQVVEQQLDESRGRLNRMGMEAGMMRRNADHNNFLQGMREAFQKDPVNAVNQIVNKALDEFWNALELRITDAFSDHRGFKRLLAQFLNEPENAALRPYGRDLEHLIRDKGMRLTDATELVRKIQGNTSQSSRLRAAAAKEIRNRAAVETDGDIGEPSTADQDLDRILKKSRSLDDIFAGLRTIKL